MWFLKGAPPLRVPRRGEAAGEARLLVLARASELRVQRAVRAAGRGRRVARVDDKGGDGDVHAAHAREQVDDVERSARLPTYARDGERRATRAGRSPSSADTYTATSLYEPSPSNGGGAAARVRRGGGVAARAAGGGGGLVAPSGPGRARGATASRPDERAEEHDVRDEREVEHVERRAHSGPPPPPPPSGSSPPRKRATTRARAAAAAVEVARVAGRAAGACTLVAGTGSRCARAVRGRSVGRRRRRGRAKREPSRHTHIDRLDEPDLPHEREPRARARRGGHRVERGDVSTRPRRANVVLAHVLHLRSSGSARRSGAASRRRRSRCARRTRRRRRGTPRTRARTPRARGRARRRRAAAGAAAAARGPGASSSASAITIASSCSRR